MNVARVIFSLFFIAACMLCSLQQARAESGNIFSEINPALEGVDFDAAIEEVVSSALGEGVGAKEILQMAMDAALQKAGLQNEDVAIAALIALLKAPGVTPEEIELAAQELRIPEDYLRIAKEDAELEGDVAYTPAEAPAPTGPGVTGVHPPPETIASPSRP